VVVSDLIVEKYSSYAQWGAINADDAPPAGSPTLSTGWTISNNEVRWNHGGAIRTGTRALVRQNYVHGNGQIGIVGPGIDLVVEENIIAENNQAHVSAGWEAGGQKLVATDRAIVRRNFAHHNDGPGLWTDIDNVNVLYEDNLCEDNAQMGIFHEIGWAAVIRYNVVRRNGYGYPDWGWGAGILVAASRDVEIHDNVVEYCADGIVGIQQDRGDGVYGPHLISNLWVHDNTIKMNDGWTGLLQDIGNDSIFGESRQNRFERNHYVLSAADGGFFAWNDVGWLSSQQWRDDYRQDVDGTFDTA